MLIISKLTLDTHHLDCGAADFPNETSSVRTSTNQLVTNLQRCRNIGSSIDDSIHVYIKEVEHVTLSTIDNTAIGKVITELCSTAETDDVTLGLTVLCGVETVTQFQNLIVISQVRTSQVRPTVNVGNQTGLCQFKRNNCVLDGTSISCLRNINVLR